MSAVQLLIITFGVVIFWGGYVANTLWGWFVVPLGVIEISYWHAVGLICVVRLFVGGLGKEKKGAGSDDIEKNIKKEAPKLIGKAIGDPAYLLAIGALAHYFMKQGS
ncbi:hypothetical protein ACI77O_13570 [Pseudomonas tritici]|uniref:hypothetical protein n=1 Tax=Pseudomonas tritici TaxID=2745518 RepID=UPI00387A8F54